MPDGDRARARAARSDQSRGQWLAVPALDQAYAAGLSLWKHRVIHAYAVRQAQAEVDLYALAAAKERIQALVDDEFRRTRRAKSRRSLARAKGIGLPTHAEPVMAPPVTPAAGGRPALVALPPLTADEDAGFGGDYNLP